MHPTVHKIATVLASNVSDRSIYQGTIVLKVAFEANPEDAEFYLNGIASDLMNEHNRDAELDDNGNPLIGNSVILESHPKLLVRIETT